MAVDLRPFFFPVIESDGDLENRALRSKHPPRNGMPPPPRRRFDGDVGGAAA